MNTAWLVWGGLALGSFAVLETIALLNHREGDTLSERLREWLGIYPVKHWRLATSAALLGLLVWFGWHIVFQQ
ncbi:hypothetical protein [Sphaerisporangium dianthi]|uniref:DUF1772 domain-containing protein n=1 Tax=Sphaerisporangium dianthi TaxID=1436120 RepID=A0ABV9CLU2_9ACTN